MAASSVPAISGCGRASRALEPKGLCEQCPSPDSGGSRVALTPDGHAQRPPAFRGRSSERRALNRLVEGAREGRRGGAAARQRRPAPGLARRASWRAPLTSQRSAPRCGPDRMRCARRPRPRGSRRPARSRRERWISSWTPSPSASPRATTGPRCDAHWTPCSVSRSTTTSGTGSGSPVLGAARSPPWNCGTPMPGMPSWSVTCGSLATWARSSCCSSACSLWCEPACSREIWPRPRRPSKRRAPSRRRPGQRRSPTPRCCSPPGAARRR